jgi:putative ATP-binding cassette transporter
VAAAPAKSQSIRPLWLNRRRFVKAIGAFLTSDVGGRALSLLLSLLVLLVGINALNVVNSYVGRDFFTAIEQHDHAAFLRQAVFYLAVFAASTAAAVFARFAEERLGLLWRGWLTRQQVEIYLHNHNYYRLREQAEVDNPDQRMTDDIRAFTTTTVSFFLLLLNASVTIFAFSGVLWSISPLLFGVAVGYAALGSGLTVAFGRPLIWLNYDQSDKEAHLRADLIHVQDNAESIAILHREGRLSERIQGRIDELVENTKRIIAVNRNLNFFTNGYNYLIQIIPALIIAPMFMRGEVEFGVITQSAIAFSTLIGAFSLIVTQFQSISSYAAVLARLTVLGEATEHARAESPIEIRDEGEDIVYDRLTLRSPRDARVLVRELSLSIPSGCHLFITGPNKTAMVALFRATAGIWQWGDGRILRPGPNGLLFLPERPYLPPGTLREILVRTGSDGLVPDAEIIETLRLLDIEALATRAGGLHVERDWENILGLGEQQLLAVARLVLAHPRFVLLDHLATSLSREHLNRVLSVLAGRAITYVSVAETDGPLGRYDATLVLASDGTWTLERVDESSPVAVTSGDA